MNPIKLIRQLGKVLRGGATRRDMFLGIFLGFAIGMVPGVNLTLVLLIVLLLFLNTNGVLAAVAILLGKALAVLLAPVTFHIGYVIIHKIGLTGLFGWAANTPVIALLNLDVYCLIGAVPFIIILGGLGAWFVPRFIVIGREKMAAVAAKGGKLQGVAGNKVARLFLRIVFGKQTETFAEMSDKKSPLIRKGRVIVGAGIIVILLLLQWLLLDTAVRVGLTKGMAAANGAEVNIASASLSLGSGKLVIEGLQVTDPARPTHNHAQAERIVADISISDLLARRLVIELIESVAFKTDAERESPGEVYGTADEASPTDEGAALADMLGTSAKYYSKVKKFNESLDKLRDGLESDEPGTGEDAVPPETDTISDEAAAKGYFGLSAKDHLTRNPTWVIHELRITQVELQPDLPTFIIEGKNLSSHPSLLEEKSELTARPDEDALKAFLGKSGLKIDKKALPLGGLFDSKGDTEAQETEANSEATDEKKGLLKGIFAK